MARPKASGLVVRRAGRIVLIPRRVVIRRGDQGAGQSAVGALAQEFDLLLGRVEDAAAVLDEEGAALVARHALLQAEFAALDLGQDLLQLLECVLKALGRRRVLLCHRAGLYRTPPAGGSALAPGRRQRTTPP